MSGDAELIKAAQKGDAKSLGILLERHRAPLYALALRFLGHGEQARDAVQETFLVALRKLDQVKDPAAVGGWLRAVLRNVCLMRLRENKGEVPFEEAPVCVGWGSPEASVEEHIDRLALREWVWTALGKLPEALQVTAMLRYFGCQCSYEEISAILGVPVGTVKSRLSAAKIKLADALLQTAGQEHDEARRLAESRARFFEAAYDERNRGKYETLIGIHSEDLVLSLSSGEFFPRGYEFLVEDSEADLEAGRKIYPTEVISSKDVSIIECEIENSPEEPFHCPPAFSQVAVYRGDRIQRLHWHVAPHPRGESWQGVPSMEPEPAAG